VNNKILIFTFIWLLILVLSSYSFSSSSEDMQGTATKMLELNDLIRLPDTGTMTRNVLFIRADFQEDTNPMTTGNGKFKWQHDDLYFQNIIDQFKKYYSEVSNGRLILQTTLLSRIYTMSHEMSYYGDTSDLIQKGRTLSLLVDTVIKADPDVDFSKNYDVIVIHAGADSQTSGLLDDISSQYFSKNYVKLVHGGFISTNDNAEVQNGLIIPEYSVPETDYSILGVLVHEYGHLLGLPDLYDVSGKSYGIGVYGLMGKGNYLGTPKRSCPAHLCAWSLTRLNFVAPELISAPGTYNISVSSTYPGKIYKIIPFLENPGEYFLLEYRKKHGFDKYLPDEGLLIWHINENQIEAKFNSNTVNSDETHKGVDLESAAQSKFDHTTDADPLDKKESGTLTNAFPAFNKSSFHNFSTPSNITYNYRFPDFSITEIKKTPEGVSFKVSFNPLPYGKIICQIQGKETEINDKVRVMFESNYIYTRENKPVKDNELFTIAILKGNAKILSEDKDKYLKGVQVTSSLGKIKFEIETDKFTFNEIEIKSVRGNAQGKTYYSYMGVLSNPLETDLSGKRRCFIATATFGSSKAKEVRYLCEFRDKFLVISFIGRTFVNLYYIVSPPLANKLKYSPLARKLVRKLLNPFIISAQTFLELSLW